MSHLVTPPTHREPDDYRGPFEPVRPVIRHTVRIVECHRCEETAIPDFVHLVNADDMPLCPDCTRHVGVALRRGLLALNQIADLLHRPGSHPAESLVWDWRAALSVAHPAEEQLLMAAAQSLADHVGYRPPGFRPSEITT